MTGPFSRYLIVGAGGFLGSIARFWLGSLIYSRFGTRFPYGTLVVNVTGCFAIGFIMIILTGRTEMSPAWRYLIPIGFIGGYTTFSTFSYETMMSFQEGAMLTGSLNILLSVIAGLIAVWLGMICGRALA